LLLNKKYCTTAQVKQNIAETPASKAERGLVKVALCTALAALPSCLYYVNDSIRFIDYGSVESAILVLYSAYLLGMAHPYILLFVGSKVREHFANDWFFWK
jgi:hypothetical protein